MAENHVILAGQSNALGYLNNGPAPYRPTVRVQIWTDTNGDGVGDEWNYMLPGHNTGTLANPAAWGPEVQFANRWLSANPTGHLWITKVAKGSTGLAQHEGVVDWSPLSTGEMYDITTAAVTASRANLDGSEFSFSQWDAVLWMQGEQDATNLADAQAYQANLTAFIAAAREDWSVERFVLGRITDSVALPYNSQVRQAQWAVPQEDANVHSFKTIGFGMQPDHIHYSGVGHLALGNSLFYAYDGW